ncbi:3-oxoacyl-ACP synthase III family protein [Flavobacterium sp. CS20]|uniref:3-oxoacyl-ACP synthase III family protein n=1 Tax=Flavobacterium sp. CS20 TaxID=2775246 RepID=UPI001B3A24DD|nr:beta-ketoacyl-ACP synthase III [Flavobacterium sp. CS20]QTY26381.1 ketoacyl-ACP synthase III [Flavobacterium sp. CS20]
MSVNVFISGTGSYTPDKIIPNSFFEKVGSNDEWIYKNLGIKERHVVENETTSDLVAKAGLNAIENAGLQVGDIDMIVVATTTPDRQAPSCACFVQDKIKAYQAVAFDVVAVCSGALFTIAVAHEFIKTGRYNNVLVIGADTFSTITDWERRDSVFFGDGAGALVLSQTTDKDKGFIDFDMHSDGRGKEHFTIPGGGSEQPASSDSLKNKQHYFQMNGKEVFDTAIKVVPKSIKNILKRNLISIDQIQYMIPHQPSIGILKSIAKTIGLPFERVTTNMDKYANTSGATIPLVLDETHKAGKFKKGDYLIFAAVGAGWTWGTALYKW